MLELCSTPTKALQKLSGQIIFSMKGGRGDKRQQGVEAHRDKIETLTVP